MKRIPKQERTAEFKEQAVKRADEVGSTARAVEELGLVEQTLRNWVKAAKAGKLNPAGAKQITAEQMELSRTASRMSGFMARAMRLATRPRAICSSTSPSSTTGAAATPHWDICRQPRSCRTGSHDRISKKWQHEDDRLEDGKRRAPHVPVTHREQPPAIPFASPEPADFNASRLNVVFQRTDARFKPGAKPSICLGSTKISAG